MCHLVQDTGATGFTIALNKAFADHQSKCIVAPPTVMVLYVSEKIGTAACYMSACLNGNDKNAPSVGMARIVTSITVQPAPSPSGILKNGHSIDQHHSTGVMSANQPAHRAVPFSRAYTCKSGRKRRTDVYCHGHGCFLINCLILNASRRRMLDVGSRSLLSRQHLVSLFTHGLVRGDISLPSLHG